MSPLKFTNFTHLGLKPRTITIVIEQSRDRNRIGDHDITPGTSFTVEANERGRIKNWIRDNVEPPFYHGDEDAWVFSRRHMLSVANLRVFTRPEARFVKRKSKTIEGLHVGFIPIKKESRR